VRDATAWLRELNGSGRSLDDPELLLTPLKRREAITSSRIEGTFVAPQQLLLYELDPREPPEGNEKMADSLEVFNYSQALQHGCSLLNELPICHTLIREMHALLMKGVRGRDKTPGEYRNINVQIGERVARFIPAPGVHVQRLIDNLEQYVQEEDARYDPLVRAYLVHYQFEAIHPFLDGNGRVGRALLSLMIYRWLGLSVPWLYMSAYFDYYNEEYVQRLFNVSAKGEWTEWIEFCLRGTIAQAKDSIRRCEGFKKLKLEFRQRVAASGSRRSYPIIDGLFSTPVVSAGSLARKHKAAFQTAQRDIARLIDAGILVPLEGTRPQCYFSPEIVDIAYGEPQWGELSKPQPVVFATASHSPLPIGTALPAVQSHASASPITWQIAPGLPSIPQGDQEQQRLGSSPSPS
jgi:Fic family protein